MFTIMNITGTHFNYYRICHRKLWLFSNQIMMEHTSEAVAIGKELHEYSYLQRSSRFKELSLDAIKIDYFDHQNKVVHEIKKSDKIEDAHIWQLKYYLFVLENNGIKPVSGVLEYPLLRKKVAVDLSDEDRGVIRDTLDGISAICGSETCPDKTKMKVCKNCSYFDFCYSSEL